MPRRAGHDRPRDPGRALLSAAAREGRPALMRPILLGLAATGCGIAQAWILATLLAALLGLGEAGWTELGMAAALALLQVALGVAQESASAQAGEAARSGLRRRIFARLLAEPPASRPAGEGATLAVDRVEAMDGYFARWIPAAALAVTAPLAVAASAAAADMVSGMILMAAGLLVPVGMAVSGIGAAMASRRQFDALQQLSGRFLDRMRGLPTLVIFRRQEDEARALDAAAQELRSRTMRVLRLAFLSTGTLELVAAAVLGCLAWRHGNLAAEGHPAPVAALFCLLLVPAFFAPFRAFSVAYHERMSAQGAAAALAPVLAASTPAGLLLEEVPPSVTLVVDHLTHRPDPGRPLALEDVSFRVLPGETLVLSGPSGSGKSTLLKLLMGFSAPDSGRIALNGRDALALAPAERRRLIAYLPQRPVLLRASIRENIRLSRPEADDAAVEAAARAAQVAAFTDDLPAGLDTIVGEGGHGLSGGQRLRVALARAFLRDAPLVLLDEPTAHLDPGTEALVIESLRRLCTGRTAIIASHSAALRARFSRVLELRDGRVVAPRRVATP
ncbi:thiol reductant ABC exporter subunit CydD [Roseomonas sp. SSH11]|uniref:Thiol reductant ABC exporter subunit CydD n=1 Tax=Pararoseomonas baculiformis TaxID=2820812 RepID=A0ABS4AAE5_9PROT|nr:thiol reductant ABC exporter subunit CydD [Pararoseomonas baculiformis]MBP0443962.1 thiol reductant ABC exporter subunit CydD [Pararoseomonas baculiformis]